MVTKLFNFFLVFRGPKARDTCYSPIVAGKLLTSRKLFNCGHLICFFQILFASNHLYLQFSQWLKLFFIANKTIKDVTFLIQISFFFFKIFIKCTKYVKFGFPGAKRCVCVYCSKLRIMFCIKTFCLYRNNKEMYILFSNSHVFMY